MKRSIARTLAAIAVAAAALSGAPAGAETYQPVQPKEPIPLDWVCKWSMVLEGQQLLGKSIMVDGGSSANASTCDLKACIAECIKTSGCVAVEIMKSAGSSKCYCRLMASVTSATFVQEMRGIWAPQWACSPVLKLPRPPADFPKGFDRPFLEQDQQRPGPPPGSGPSGRQ